jgi:hypothetical protein
MDYSISQAGVLTPLPGSPFPTLSGSSPAGMLWSGKFLDVAHEHADASRSSPSARREGSRRFRARRFRRESQNPQREKAESKTAPFANREPNGCATRVRPLAMFGTDTENPKSERRGGSF